MVALPQGFKVISAPAAAPAAGSLPPGFKIVSQPAQPAAQAAPPASGGIDPLAMAVSGTQGLINGLPVIGLLAQEATDALIHMVSPQTVDNAKQARDVATEKYPGWELAGELASTGGTYGALTKIPVLAEALGTEGKLIPRVVKGGASQLAIGTADSIARGEAPVEALKDNLAPAATVAALPLVGKVAKTAAKVVNNAVVKPIATALNPANEAIQRVAKAVTQDRGSGKVLSPADEQVAQQAGADVVNADRFGNAIRTLARTAANASPEADNALKDVVQGRFATQGQRAGDFVKQLMGGATDDLALQDSLRDAARASNKTAYDAAKANPNSQAIWNPKLQGLMQAPEFQTAVKEAEGAAKTDAALAGGKAVQNPFKVGPDGMAELKTRSDRALDQLNAAKKTGDDATIARAQAAYDFALKNDGPDALPNLQFWDIVQRNLRKQIEALKPTERTAKANLVNLRGQLLGELDTAVPEFKTARQGAAGFFGAEDAVDAGRKAFNSPMQVSEIGRGVQKMTPAEKDAFSVGYSSEMIDRINATRDRVNVIDNLFGSDSVRKRNVIALGGHRARQLEAYVKMEQSLDMLRGAVSGNSSTVKQLVAAGALGGGTGLGALAMTGDWRTGGMAAMLALGARHYARIAGKRIDEDVMKKVADILVSKNPADLQKSIQQAALSQQHLNAIDAILKGMQIPVRAAASVATRPSGAP